MNRSMEAALVITTLNEPNEVVEILAEGSIRHRRNFIVIGDRVASKYFDLEGAWFFGAEERVKTGFSYPAKCPYGHYARKNIGYLLAMSSGATMIQETDDDSLPYDTFWEIRDPEVNGECYETGDWLNVYQLFSDSPIWPRGYPLQKLRTSNPSDSYGKMLFCPIQQGLVEDHPDVDAIHRLIYDTTHSFRQRSNVIFRDTYCPFNSQNTQWWKDAFVLMYLPSYCNFRMASIWRSFIAQHIAYVNGWGICFHDATVYQGRNEHDLMQNFEDEMVGYLRNYEMVERLKSLRLRGTKVQIGADLITCYEALCADGFFEETEIELVKAWVEDCYSLLGTQVDAS